MKIKRKLRTIKYDIDRKLWRTKKKIRGIIRRRIKGQYRAGEIINLTFKKIKKKHAEKEIVFPHYVLSLIADDSDYHRTRQGFMRYDSVIVVKLGDNNWVMAKGRAWGDYPADPYDNDILVGGLGDSLKGKSNQKLAEEIMEQIGSYWNSGFVNSIIAARNSGHLFTGRRWQEVMADFVAPKISEFVEKGLETHEGYVTLEVGGIVPAVKSSIKYKKEFADFLAKTIIEIISNSK